MGTAALVAVEMPGHPTLSALAKRPAGTGAAAAGTGIDLDADLGADLDVEVDGSVEVNPEVVSRATTQPSAMTIDFSGVTD